MFLKCYEIVFSSFEHVECFPQIENLQDLQAPPTTFADLLKPQNGTLIKSYWSRTIVVPDVRAKVFKGQRIKPLVIEGKLLKHTFLPVCFHNSTATANLQPVRPRWRLFSC
ncbi:hypothetical protein CEXT_31871 [Caerostris extrusa]|uniref:Uncharacterized protein n=1 Tax=Caerostris extrusa TaxID=172846 RepID=A0AAV4XNV8_CAEEX|nr:hypothetical protein CEXT_31871 [Caerostris extrusa]